MFNTSKTRWWFQIFFIFTPIWGKISNLTSIFFRWVVQPPTRKTFPCFFRRQPGRSGDATCADCWEHLVLGSHGMKGFGVMLVCQLIYLRFKKHHPVELAHLTTFSGATSSFFGGVLFSIHQHGINEICKTHLQIFGIYFEICWHSKLLLRVLIWSTPR